MKLSLRRNISRALAVVMTTCTVFANFTGFEVAAADKTIDVWDFGSVQASGSLYTNHISTDMLDAIETLGDGTNGTTKGLITADSNIELDGITVNTLAKDRMFYNGADGKKSYGSNGKASTAYSDGYTANGMWYANGKGGDNRRYVIVHNVNAGDGVSIYAGPNNSEDITIHFTNGSEDDTFNVPSGTMSCADFVANNSGDYKIWFGAESGKPCINRVVRYPGVDVSGTIDLNGHSVTNYTVTFKNDKTGDVFDAVLNGSSYTATLTPGYSYTAVMSGAVGFGFTNETKKITVANEDIASGKTANLAVETKSTYTVNGKITGFASAYDISKLTVDLIPAADSLADNVTATVSSDLSYTAVLEPDVPYTVVLKGVNDYEIVSGGTIESNKNLTQDINVATKAVYDATGSFVGLDGASVTSLSFVNVDDDYSYSAAVTSNGYSAKLRDGSYLAVAEASGYSTRTHVVVDGAAVKQDLLFVQSPKPALVVDYSKDVYVGCTGKSPNYDTMKEAMAAVKAMNPTSEAQRITVHIAPGVYREQLTVDTPYLTFVKEGEGEVKLTWYYGIGYKYYSAQSTGYYDEQDAFEKYGKNTAQKWGVATYIKAAAKGFRADGITFEASFNKYVTDEEIVDGVEVSGTEAITYTRSLGADVTKKSATERASAICIEGDDSEFNNCRFLGSQDTLYTGGAIDTYFKDCYIEGNTDYIFGTGDAVFDGCELCFAGYSDTATGGYVTAARGENSENGYLFRSCTITNNADAKSAPGYFGRPWDQNAKVFFANTKLQNSNAIMAEGWTSMSSATPDKANYKEYNTTYIGQAVDTTGRVAGTLQTANAPSPKTYFGDWTPSFYVEENGTPTYATAPYFSTDGDVARPATGNTFTVKYDLDLNADVDASRIDWYTVKDGTETLIKSVSVAEKDISILLTNATLGCKIKAVVTPILYSGAQGTPVTLVTDAETVEGSEYREATRPSGKTVVFLAGDSTVKDYSAGAINNSGANRPEGSWGEFLKYYLDSSKYEVMDFAEGGRSSRTFMDGTKADGSDKFLDKIKAEMTTGDYLFIQFGHNDSSKDYTDRYVPVGTPDANGNFPYTAPSSEGAADGTFCWYLQQYVDAANAAGATPVLVTPVSRMYFAAGKITSHHGSNDEYVTATKQVAEKNGILCIDLYTLSKDLYEEAYAATGDDSEASRLFAYGEKTHHSKLGGFALAAIMADQIEDTDLGLKDGVIKPASLSATDQHNNMEFKVWSDSTFEGYGKNAEGVYDTKIAETYWTPYINGLIANIGSTSAATSLGDVNEDGSIDAFDSSLTLQYVLNPQAVIINLKNADVDGKDGINAADAAYILQKALVSTYPLPLEAA